MSSSHIPLIGHIGLVYIWESELVLKSNILASDKSGQLLLQNHGHRYIFCTASVKDGIRFSVLVYESA